MKYLLLFLFVFASVSNNFAQCSDSGICTLGGHSENQSGDIKNYSFGLNYSFSASMFIGVNKRHGFPPSLE